MKKGAPPVGLYLRIGPDLALEELVRDLRQIFFVINRSEYEKNMHVLEIVGAADDGDFRDKAAALFSFARGNGIACIFRGLPEDAKDLGADGVLLADAGLYPAARDLFGDEGIVGLACGISKEMAAEAYDLGADFVSFGTGKNTLTYLEALRFWAILTDKPALVEGPITNDYCAYYVQAGASFIDAADYIWSHGEGVMKGTVNMLHAIDLALEEKSAGRVQ